MTLPNSSSTWLLWPCYRHTRSFPGSQLDLIELVSCLQPAVRSQHNSGYKHKVWQQQQLLPHPLAAVGCCLHPSHFTGQALQQLHYTLEKHAALSKHHSGCKQAVPCSRDRGGTQPQPLHFQGELLSAACVLLLLLRKFQNIHITCPHSTQ